MTYVSDMESYAPSSLVKIFRAVPRFSHSDSVETIFTEERMDYILGLLFLPGFLVSFFFLWSLSLVVLKCLTAPHYHHRRNRRKLFFRRNSTSLIIFLCSFVLLVTCSLLLIGKGQQETKTTLVLIHDEIENLEKIEMQTIEKLEYLIDIHNKSVSKIYSIFDALFQARDDIQEYGTEGYRSLERSEFLSLDIHNNIDGKITDLDSNQHGHDEEEKVEVSHDELKQEKSDLIDGFWSLYNYSDTMMEEIKIFHNESKELNNQSKDALWLSYNDTNNIKCVILRGEVFFEEIKKLKDDSLHWMGSLLLEFRKVTGEALSLTDTAKWGLKKFQRITTRSLFGVISVLVLSSYLIVGIALSTTRFSKIKRIYSKFLSYFVLPLFIVTILLCITGFTIIAVVAVINADACENPEDTITKVMEWWKVEEGGIVEQLVNLYILSVSLSFIFVPNYLTL